MSRSGETLFDRAARVFDGRTDPETGLAVLRVADNRTVTASGRPPALCWRTAYHQYGCFLDGGRRVLLVHGELTGGLRSGACDLLDLVDGGRTSPFPTDAWPLFVHERSRNAFLYFPETADRAVRLSIWDTDRREELARIDPGPWRLGWADFLVDGDRAVVATTCFSEGGSAAVSRLVLFDASGETEVLLEEPDVLFNHVQGHPVRDDLFSFDAWPFPQQPTPMVIRIRSLDGTIDRFPEADADMIRPGPLWGGQRDHYVWTPDGARIVSYLCPDPVDDPDDHFTFGWWLSVLDTRTGSDTAVPYPPGRWGCHVQVDPSSRRIVSAGGPGFFNIYVVDMDALAHGWNERLLCACPETDLTPDNSGLFAMPRFLPDGSGVLFTAGWPRPHGGVYLVERPGDA